LLAAIEDGVENVVETVAEPAVETAQVVTTPAVIPEVAEQTAEAAPGPTAPIVTAPPPPRPETVVLASAETVLTAPEEPEIVTHISTSDGGSWGIDVGLFSTRYDAERVLLKIALGDLGTLGSALRKANNRPDGWHADFVGMSREAADLACRRLEARAQQCTLVGPG